MERLGSVETSGKARLRRAKEEAEGGVELRVDRQDACPTALRAVAGCCWVGCDVGLESGLRRRVDRQDACPIFC